MRGLVGFRSSAVVSTTAQACRCCPFSARQRRDIFDNWKCPKCRCYVVRKTISCVTNLYQFDIQPLGKLPPFVRNPVSADRCQRQCPICQRQRPIRSTLTLRAKAAGPTRQQRRSSSPAKQRSAERI